MNFFKNTSTVKMNLVIAIRILTRTHIFTLTNILGLAIGMATCLIMLSYVNFERSYDRFHNHHDRIYRIRYERYSDNGESVCFASCCPPIGLRIREHFPEVEQVARIARFPASVSFEENRFIEEQLFYAEAEFFSLFSFRFIEGDPANGIKNPNTAFLSRSAAIKYFGNESPVGKSIRIDQKTEYQITGIFEDMPMNSHIKMDIVLPWANLLRLLGADFDESWGDSGAFTYVLFREGANIADFQNKLNDIAMNEFGAVLKKYRLRMELPMQPLADIHLKSHYQQEFETNGNSFTINILLAVAIFIIVMAWINYINLSTAHSLNRAREVGLRKVIGASRSHIVNQFFTEVALINLSAIIISIFLVELLEPYFGQIAGIYFEHRIMEQLNSWVAIILIFLAGVFIAGLYPVVILASFKPLEVLKGKLFSNRQGIRLRKILVVFQFCLALGLLSGTFAVFSQISFMRQTELGFTKDDIVAIRAPRVTGENYKSNVNSFKQELLKNPDILGVCVLTEVPGKQIYWDAGGIAPVGSDESKNYQIVGIDHDFVDIFQVKIVEGRNFSKDFPSDSVGLILNETAVKWMGFPDTKTAIGSQVNYWGIIYTIVGVMKDYHQQSPKKAFEPHLYRLMPYGRGNRGMFAIRLKPDNSQATVQNLRNKYDQFFPGNSFDFFYLNEYFDRQYRDDLILGKVLTIFSILAIIVTALGILGLYSFMVNQRVKEISIRSVLGADTITILLLFAREFIALLLISFVIIVPLSYYGISKWLNSFACKTEPAMAVFIIPLLLVFIVAVLTISSLVFKATRANPADILRYE